MAAFPEMEKLTVDLHKWLAFHQLIHLYSVGQLAPWPNMMMIVAIGDWAGGILGAIAVLVAFFDPTALLALIVGRLWNKLEKWPWRESIQKGLAPVSIGLLLAGTLSMAKGAVAGWTTGGIALAVLLTILWRKINRALLVVAGAIVGGIVFFPGETHRRFEVSYRDWKRRTLRN